CPSRRGAVRGSDGQGGRPAGERDRGGRRPVRRCAQLVALAAVSAALRTRTWVPSSYGARYELGAAVRVGRRGGTVTGRRAGRGRGRRRWERGQAGRPACRW